MTSSPWTALAHLDDNAHRFGHKSCQLARVLRAGLPVPDSWVLSVDEASNVKTTTARQLMDLHPTARWILRSSSPWEDRPDHSRAGQFASAVAAATPEEIAAALSQVVASSAGRSMAVLAQPHLVLDAWLTIELRADRWWAEGFLQDGWRGARQGDKIADDDPLAPLLSLARRAALRNAPSLLEVGSDLNGPVILQLRPAPSRPAPWRSAPPENVDNPEPPPPHEASPGPEWVWDQAHCPVPLCPLLAGLFDQWLETLPDHWPSRLFKGRWHDRIEAQVPPSSAPTSNDLSRWAAQREALRDSLVELAQASEHWSRFLPMWLQWQRTYFEDYGAATQPLRRWAKTVALRHPLPPLPLVVAPRLQEALGDLTQTLRTQLAARPPLVSYEVVPRDLDELLRRSPQWQSAVRVFLLEHGHHSPSPAWDGRGTTWAEDPWPLWRHLLTFDEVRPPEPQARTASHEATLAARILAQCEDDDDELARAYALFRTAAMQHAKTLVAEADPRWIFDVFPRDLERIERDPSQLDTVVALGRAVYQNWLAYDPLGSIDAEPGYTPGHTQDDMRGDTRSDGRAASGGRAEGPLRRLAYAQQNGGPSAGEILVVPTLVPGDAVVLSKVAAVVCEGGDVLGHASVLAREYGVPAIVGLAHARLWLATADRATVDADLGWVTRHEKRTTG